MTYMMQVDDGGGRGRLLPVEYPSNSKNRKTAGGQSQPKPKAEQVISGKVSQRKKGWKQRFRQSMLGDGGFEGVIETLITDILVSAFKGMISDAVTQTSSAVRDGVDRFLYPDTRARTSRDRPTGYYNYSRTPRRYPVPEYRTISTQARREHDFNDIILESRGDAEVVLDGLREIVDKYGVADVGDLYDLVGITGSFVDNSWGWTNLDDAMVRPVRGGFLISLPRTQPID